MPRKVIRGTGITAREETVYDMDDPEMSGALRRSVKNWNSAIDEGGGIFGAVSLQAARSCEHILANARDETPFEDSPEAFAQLIAKYIAVAKDEIERGNADLAARFAFVAGMEWAKAWMKWAWEPEAMTGQKVREAAAQGGRKAGATAARDVALAQEFLRRRSTSRLSDSALKASVGGDRGLSRSAAIDAINRGLKKVSG